MALTFVRKKKKKSDGTYDTIHYETSAKVVWTEDGDSIEDVLKNVSSEVDEALEGVSTQIEEALQNVGCDGASATLSASGWTEQSDGSFSQRVTVQGVTTSNQIIVDCSLTGSDIAADIEVLNGWGCVNRASQASNSLTFYCYGSVPTVSIPINVVIG